MSCCDLHTHSIYSDGTFTPAALITAAKETGLEAVALTDHNTVAGLPNFLAAAEGSGVEPVAGIEISTDYDNVELHILALFVKPADYDPITKLMEEMVRRKEEANVALVKALNRAGYSVNLDAIKAAAEKGVADAVGALEADVTLTIGNRED